MIGVVKHIDNASFVLQVDKKYLGFDHDFLIGIVKLSETFTKTPNC